MPIYNRADPKVRAFSAWHDDGNPAFGFRIDYKGHAVVLSGDTSYSEQVVLAGKGVDLIVHNVIAAATGHVNARAEPNHMRASLPGGKSLARR